MAPRVGLTKKKSKNVSSHQPALSSQPSSQPAPASQPTSLPTSSQPAPTTESDIILDLEENPSDEEF